jgi:acyl-CoA thioesterase
MEEASFSTLMDFAPAGRGHKTFIPEDWRQGRTAYGGLTAAMCLQATLKDFPDLPPLRSAQITFIGPASEEVQLQTTLLRQGKNMTIINADLISEKGLATRAVFSFGTTRDSHISKMTLPMPDAKPAADCEPLFPVPELAPTFTRHYEQRLLRGGIPFSGATEADNLLWIRYREWQENKDMVAFLALGDATPPAIMSNFTTFGPISTVSWLVNMLTDTPETDDGWWLLRAHAEHTQNGYSSQDMTMWNTRGEPVMKAQQSIAIFV